MSFQNNVRDKSGIYATYNGFKAYSGDKFENENDRKGIIYIGNRCQNHKW